MLRNSSTKKRVFLVDDDSDNLTVLSYLFESLGCEVVTCQSSLNALDHFLNYTKKDGVFDFVALDIRMPKIDGNSIAKAIRKSGYKGMIVAITASPTEAGAEESLKFGFDHYISKHEINKNLIKDLLDQKN